MSIITTKMLDFIERSGFDKFESRPSQWGAWQLFQSDTMAGGGIVTPNLQERALAAIGSTLKTPVINYDGTIAIRSTRPLVIPQSENTTALVTISFTTFAFGIREYPALYVNNYITREEDFANKMKQRLFALGNAVDTACLTALDAAKTQVLSDTLGARYGLVANVVTGALAEQDSIIGDLNLLQGGNDFYGFQNVVGNNSLQSLLRNRLTEQGEFNQSDKSYQMDDKKFFFTNRLGNAGTDKATGFSVEPGSVGFLYQFEPDSLLETETSNHKWGKTVLPLLNIPVGTYTYDGVEDATAGGSNPAGAAGAELSRTSYKAYDFAGIFAFVTAYNSAPATLAGPVMKFAVAKV
ncbi:MAG: putative structural protein [Prokaryotic dsDNA virus sp.]|nr:MAG: putative structural protein [Prokaryotic dsDNA virus sp.]|tara:strand:- start:2651 stop:3706 length:1056 start_codon:yes stop_codon:yes gene_type:complete